MFGEFLLQIGLTVDPDQNAFALRLALLPVDIRLRHGHPLRHAKPPFMKIAVKPVESRAKRRIISAIVIPQFTNASDQAAESQARTQLQSMRSQCQLFRAQFGYLPGDADDDGAMDSITACFEELVDEDFIPPYPPAPAPVGPSLGSNFTWDLSTDGSRLVITASDDTDTSSW